MELEEAAAMVPTPVFLLNGIQCSWGRAQGAVAGDLRRAFREGARLSAALFSVRAPSSSLVIVSDSLPVTADLYQASKLVAAAAPLVADGGTVLLLAPCPRGTGPLQTVNEDIYRIGLRPRLPAAHRIVLVSDLAPDVVGESYCEYAADAQEVIDRSPVAPTILPRAGSLIASVLEEGA